MSIDAQNAKGGNRQFIMDVRGSGPNSNVIVKDINGRILRIETPSGQVLKELRVVKDK